VPAARAAARPARAPGPGIRVVAAPFPEVVAGVSPSSQRSAQRRGEAAQRHANILFSRATEARRYSQMSAAPRRQVLMVAAQACRCSRCEAGGECVRRRDAPGVSPGACAAMQRLFSTSPSVAATMVVQRCRQASSCCPCRLPPAAQRSAATPRAQVEGRCGGACTSNSRRAYRTKEIGEPCPAGGIGFTLKAPPV